MKDLAERDIRLGDSLPKGQTRLLTVIADELPKGYLGYYSVNDDGAHLAWVHRRCGRKQRAETIIHEVLHFLCGHTSNKVPAWQHEIIDQIGIDVARTVMALVDSPDVDAFELAARTTEMAAPPLHSR